MFKIKKYFRSCFHDPAVAQRKLASAMMESEEIETVRKRLTQVEDIEAVFPDSGLKPLEMAINKRNGLIVRLLLEKGAAVNKSSIPQWTPLLRACDYGCLDSVKVLVEHGADLTAKTQDGFTCLSLAAKEIRLSVVSYLLEQESCPVDGVDADGRTVLHHVVLWNDSVVTSKLISKGVDINAQNQEGETPLFLATKHNYPASFRVLLKSGADPNICTSNGESALIEALTEGRVEMVSMLLNHGADSSTFDKSGQSPVQLAMDVMLARERNKNPPHVIHQVVPQRNTTNPLDAVNRIGETASSILDLVGMMHSE